MIPSWHRNPPTLDDSPLAGETGLRDSPSKTLILGILAPVGLIALVILNLISGEVYWPRRGFGFETYNHFWPIVGTIMLKLGVAGILGAWYGLANFVRTERFCWPLAWTCAAMACAGLVTFTVSAINW